MAPLDDVMHGLVGKLGVLGYEHTLALEFRLESVTFDHGIDYNAYFLKFKEVGRVRIVDVSSREALDITVRFRDLYHVVVADSHLSELDEDKHFPDGGQRKDRLEGSGLSEVLHTFTLNLLAGAVATRFGSARVMFRALLLVYN